MRTGGPLLNGLRRSGLLNCRHVRHVASEFATKRRCVVSEDLRIVRPARDGDISHAPVEQIFRANFGVHVDQDAVSGLSLAGMARHSLAVVERQLPVRIELHGAAIPANRFDIAQFAAGYLRSFTGAVN